MRGESDFYQLRRTGIRDFVAGLAFLIGFIGFAPYAWPYLDADVKVGEIARGMLKFLGVVVAGGVSGGILGLIAGTVIGRMWEMIHRAIRGEPRDKDAPHEVPHGAAISNVQRRPGNPELAWAIRYSTEAIDVDSFLALANQVWPRSYDRAPAAAALAKTINVGAWRDAQLVGAVRVLTDGYFFAVVSEIIVHPDYRRLGIGRELMSRAIEAAPRRKVFLGAQPQAVGFFERLGATAGPRGMVLERTAPH
jgi:ribosomal protein S18 acetylase RimI-like enzyme